MTSSQVKELVLQSLEQERGGLRVYRTALLCVRNEDLASAWQTYMEQTEQHVEALTTVCDALGLDPLERTPGCLVVARTDAALVEAMELALEAGDAGAAELVACDCVLLAETQDHANWGLIGACAKALSGPVGAALQAAYDAVEDQEDEHLYHTKAWRRALWSQYLGLPSALPPVEEVQHVTTTLGDPPRRAALMNHVTGPSTGS
jgi:hypothetical protein